MQKIFASAVIVLIIHFTISCSGEKNSMAGRPQIIYRSGEADTIKDSVVFYDMEVKAKAVSYKKELEGKWRFVTMRRQQKAELETLDGVLDFSADSAFYGKAPCNNMGGVYTLKGTGIRFSKIYSTKKGCSDLEKESAMLRLLEETVSAFTVNENRLLLRDGAGNIVFECERG